MSDFYDQVAVLPVAPISTVLIEMLVSAAYFTMLITRRCDNFGLPLVSNIADFP